MSKSDKSLRLGNMIPISSSCNGVRHPFYLAGRCSLQRADPALPAGRGGGEIGSGYPGPGGQVLVASWALPVCGARYSGTEPAGFKRQLPFMVICHFLLPRAVYGTVTIVYSYGSVRFFDKLPGSGSAQLSKNLFEKILPFYIVNFFYKESLL